MKLKSPLLLITALLGVTIANSLAADPSVKSKADNIKAKARTESAIPGAGVQSTAYFYTGKPYDDDLDCYVFNYRTYSPGLSSWTTPDPSGFPDGVNNSRYAPCPTNELDALGLVKEKTFTSGGKSYALRVEDPIALAPAGAPIPFAGWTFAAGAALNIPVGVHHCDPYVNADKTWAGADYRLEMNNLPALAAGRAYDWLQIVTTVDSTGPNTFFDKGAAPTPFYGGLKGRGTSPWMSDTPQRQVATFLSAANPSITWTATTFIADYSAAKDVVIHEGVQISWSLTLLPAE